MGECTRLILVSLCDLDDAMFTQAERHEGEDYAFAVCSIIRRRTYYGL
jgi:hypothetical protein